MFAVASAAASAVFENPRLRDSGSSRTSTSLRTPTARSVSISDLASACCSYPVVNTVGIPAIFDMTRAVLRPRNRERLVRIQGSTATRVRSPRLRSGPRGNGGGRAGQPASERRMRSKRGLPTRTLCSKTRPAAEASAVRSESAPCRDGRTSSPNLSVDFQRSLPLVPPDHAAVDPTNETGAHRALDVERWVVRGDAQRRVDVPERVRIIGLGSEAVAAGDWDEVVLSPVAVVALGPEPLGARVGEQNLIRSCRLRTTCHRARQRAKEVAVLLRITARLRALHDATVDVALADVYVPLAEISGGVMTTEDGEEFPRPEAAVRDRLDEIRGCLAEARDRWNGNPARSYHRFPPRSADPGLKHRFEFEEVSPDLLNDLGEVGPANEPHAGLGRCRHEC